MATIKDIAQVAIFDSTPDPDQFDSVKPDLAQMTRKTVNILSGKGHKSIGNISFAKYVSPTLTRFILIYMNYANMLLKCCLNKCRTKEEW